ncbi:MULTISPECIES: hypothetical protein [unclassified Caballeronia]|uniref:zinc-ribbon domain-containing protein n=1 Tax=unclassified Caballeronia TaxID=2646786 RepID=UPI00285F2F99|nr:MULTISPECIES: hypothetical protein [unclassified Caballeronia]MDR5777537.1 hypothetical protein [Caballeronia sp. LZ002]MDR5852980.1 hypothetical protein [Caballeronia sp. LZ003]
MTQQKKRGGPKPLTIEAMRALAATRGGRCLSTHYVNANTRLEWECAEGHQWFAVPNSIKCGTWCKLCGYERTKATLKDVQEAATKFGGHCLSERYVNGTTPLLFECAAGHRWEAPPATVRQGHWCRRCLFDRRRSTIDELRDVAARRGGQCLSAAYTDKHQKLRWRCASGHEWESLAAIVRSGHWCPHCERERRRTGIGRMREIAAERGGHCLSERYDNARTLLRWQCAQGHTWEASATQTQRGQWCSFCSGHRHSIAGMQALAHSRGGKCLSEVYVDSRQKLQWQCVADHTWFATPSVTARYWCTQCSQERRGQESIGRMRELATQRGGQCLSARYVTAATPLMWQCREGHQWQMAPQSITNRARWCPYCSGRRKYTLTDMKELAQARGGDCLSNSFVSSHDRVQWLCGRGHAWSARAYQVISGTWCPQCAILDRCLHQNSKRRYQAVAMAEGVPGPKSVAPKELPDTPSAVSV